MMLLNKNSYPFNSLIRSFKQNLINLPGWKTKRKIVVFQSDDWGSTRMPSKAVYNKLLDTGIRVDKNFYSRFDSLESNEDLEALYEVLLRHKDINGNNPTFTAVMCSANPDFDKIKEEKFLKYHYTSHRNTLQKYGSSYNQVINLWKEGISNKIFSPEFHGREHLNIKRWMKAISINESDSQIAAANGFAGLTLSESQEDRQEYLPAFDIDSVKDIKEQGEIIRTGIGIFEQLFGFRPSYFVPPNSLMNSGLYNALSKEGIRYISGARRSKEPLGHSKFKTNFQYVGKTNKYNQIFLPRNVQFEQGSISGFSHLAAIEAIGLAFRWKKPAIISTHRVNYIGSIDEKNRKKGLDELNKLIEAILKKWPDVEFLSTKELGDCVNNE